MIYSSLAVSLKAYVHGQNILLHFDTNTIWYLQFHFVYDKLCVSFILNVLLLMFPLSVSRPLLYSTSKGVFTSFLHRLSYHSTTRLSRGFLHTKKSYRKIALYFSNCFNISTLVFTFETELIKSFKASPSIRITWLAFANS